jgi:hypothetical protein
LASLQFLRPPDAFSRDAIQVLIKATTWHSRRFMMAASQTAKFSPGAPLKLRKGA